VSVDLSSSGVPRKSSKSFAVTFIVLELENFILSSTEEFCLDLGDTIAFLPSADKLFLDSSGTGFEGIKEAT
jgi:hypothetical protein